MKQVEKLFLLSMILSLSAWLSFAKAFSLWSYYDMMARPIQTTGYLISLFWWLYWLSKISNERVLRGPLFPKSINNGGVGSK